MRDNAVQTRACARCGKEIYHARQGAPGGPMIFEQPPEGTVCSDCDPAQLERLRRNLEANIRAVDPAWESYAPKWAPHVVGRFSPEEVDEETGEREPRIVAIACGQCGGTYRLLCHSGVVRQHVLNFAKGHLHRDPMEKKT
jgi:hypothetical protein